MKRTNRKLSDKTKQKISAALRGKNKSIQHKEAIAKGMEKYWSTIPDQIEENNSINLKADEKWEK